jgi:hypothetical protein
MLWLLFALAVAAWVITRDTAGYVNARELAEVRERHLVLKSMRNDLVRRIRRAESRAILVPKAESLGLRLPADSQMIILQTPGYEER